MTTRNRFGYVAASHRCAAHGCRLKVSKAFLMCPAHWGCLPAEIRDRVTRYYRPGRPLSEQFEEYRVAVRHAIEALRGRQRSKELAP